jgi:hypothetical protein
VAVSDVVDVEPSAGSDADMETLAAVEPTAPPVAEPAATPERGGASYEDFGSFWNALTGN